MGRLDWGLGPERRLGVVGPETLLYLKPHRVRTCLSSTPLKRVRVYPNRRGVNPKEDQLVPVGHTGEDGRACEGKTLIGDSWKFNRYIKVTGRVWRSSPSIIAGARCFPFDSESSD